MPRFPIIAALLLVAACGQQKSSDAIVANEAAAAPAAEPAAPAFPELSGEWQVAEIDGRPVEPGSAMTASFGAGKLRVTAGCSRRSWAFTQKRNIVSFAAYPAGSSNCETPTSFKQESAFQAFDRATMAIFDKRGREATLSGDGGNVTLVRR